MLLWWPFHPRYPGSVSLKVMLVSYTPHLHYRRTYNAINHTRQEVVDQHDQLDHETPSGYVDCASRAFQCRDHSFCDYRRCDSSEPYYWSESRVRKHDATMLRRLLVECGIYGPRMNPHDTNAPGSQFAAQSFA